MARIDHYDHLHAALELREIRRQLIVIIVCIVCANAGLKGILFVFVKFVVAMRRMRIEEHIARLGYGGDIRYRLAYGRLRSG